MSAEIPECSFLQTAADAGFVAASPAPGSSPRCVNPQPPAGAGFPMNVASVCCLPPGRPISSGWSLLGKFQMKS